MAEKGSAAAHGKKGWGIKGKKQQEAGKHSGAERGKETKAKKQEAKNAGGKKAEIKAQKKSGKKSGVKKPEAKTGKATGKAETKKESAGKAAKKKKKGRGKKTKKTAVQKVLEKIKERIKEKARHAFTGRFGKRMVRRHGRGKWARWRHPRGIDIRHAQQYGLVPKSGYKTRRSIRFLHPSGMREVLVYNAKELETVPRGHAVRISSGVGAAKRSGIVREAKRLNLKMLNA